MGLIAVVSAGGAPGATTTALALTLAWPEPALMAECDCDGGSVLAGLFGGHFPADRGLLNLAWQITEDPGRVALHEQTYPLDDVGDRPVLPGPADPFQAQAITAVAWEKIAAVLARQTADVIADVGQVRAVGYPFAVLAAADLIVLVLRPTLRQVVAARPRVAAIRDALGRQAAIGLCLIGRGPHSVAEVRKVLGGDFAVVVQFPDDARSAARLSDGDPKRRRLTRSSDLLVQARTVARALRAAVDHRPGRRPDRPVSPLSTGGGRPV
ncbi:hypothetical protein [Actinomadura sp. 6K520]|uniref:hypothetical protein n=1 Tax=Actinomadura sp. 6K520 TaxID=2530364 RepID=UPI00104B8978|nr:hypothetical protein [Actinomadura sp. 6K520]TDE32118.1 hypothetical protein E1289_16575 [Actinomadura sp. 6K520]